MENIEITMGQLRALSDWQQSHPPPAPPCTEKYEIGEDVHIPIINKHGYVKKVLTDCLRIEFVGGEVKKVPKYLVQKMKSNTKFKQP